MKVKIATQQERRAERQIRERLAACVTVATIFPDSGVTAEVWKTPTGYELHGRGIELLGLDPATQCYELSGVVWEQEAIQQAENLMTAKLKEYAA